ncbi:MAG: N-acetylmuramoyl-L-alanine amidase, partial [Lacunisphaera sp.]|nr:N-acetylmuramoyl-L-alanine amidase [Lacunisphaera sp.]
IERDDEIIVAGQRFATGTRVITWKETGGYNAYVAAPTLPKYYDVRLAPAVAGDKGPRKTIPPGLDALQGFVDQVVLHYDNSGLSQLCFAALRQRGLSAHFLVDIDGTVYQTLDLQERALHATTSNSRSLGIEIANFGAYPPKDARMLAKWYQPDAAGRTRIMPPKEIRDPRIHTPGFVGRPARPEPVRGRIHGQELVQYDYTPEQYAALAKLTAALCRVFPRIPCDYPRDAAGRPLLRKLPDAVLEKYRGILGHWHVQENKIDPGPAFDWDRLIEGARAAGKPPAGPEPAVASASSR